MKEEKNEEKQTYSIPGVIIPEQTTDSGVLISSQKENNNEVKESITEKEDNNSKQGVYDIPGIIIPEQKTDSGNIENINNVNENNIYKEEKKEIIDTSVSPIMPGLMPEKKEEIKTKKIKKEKKEGNATIGILEVIIVILLGAVLYFAYNTYINPPKVSSEDYKTLNNQVFDKNGYIINELYSWINLSGCNSLSTSLYNDNDVTKVGDLKDEEKLYLAYLQLKNKDFSSVNCSNYSNALHSKNKDSNWYCGNNISNNDSENKSLMFDSKILKNQVLRMFGQGEYKQKNFKINGSSRYFYDKSGDTYILQTSDDSTTCSNISIKLNKVYNYDNVIILGITIKNIETNKEEIRYAKFLKSSNGNYYFDQISHSM